MRTVRELSGGGKTAIAVLGGTFDPVHYGHLRTALEVREHLKFNDFRFMPAGRPPHRNYPVTDANHRLAMLRLAVRGVPGVSIDERELHREGPSYMTDTLQALRSDEGDVPLVLVIGQDSANTLDNWYKWQRIFPLAHLVIMSRPGDDEDYSVALQSELEGRWVESVSGLSSRTAGCVMKLEVTRLAISSSEIREMLRCGKSPRYLLPDPVLDYIREQGLYLQAVPPGGEPGQSKSD